MAAAAANVTGLITLSGNNRIVTATLTLDPSYPTGGSPSIAKLLGLNTITALIPLHHKGYLHEYDKANDKLKSYTVGGAGGSVGVEVVNTTNLSAVTVDVVAIGTTA